MLQKCMLCDAITDEWSLTKYGFLCLNCDDYIETLEELKEKIRKKQVKEAQKRYMQQRTQIKITVTEEQKNKIKSMAAEEKLSVTAYIIKKTLGDEENVD